MTGSSEPVHGCNLSAEVYDDYLNTPITCLPDEISEESRRLRALGLWEANVKSSKGRLKDYLRQASNPASGVYFVFAQDPPKQLPFLGTGNFYLRYTVDRPLTAQDSPIYPKSTKGRAKQARVA